MKMSMEQKNFISQSGQRKGSKMEKEIKATCSSCGELFLTTEAYVRQVQEGKEVSLCGKCSGDNMAKTIEEIIAEVKQKMGGKK